MSQKAFITGITGQDGSYLTEFLLDKGYEVHGMVRRTSSLDRSRLVQLYHDPEVYGRRLFLHYADLDDSTTLRRVLFKASPDEVYHLAGQSHVGLSFEIPESTCDMTAMGTLRLLEMIRDAPNPPKFFHAASSEIFGRPAQSPQTEETPMAPVSPYGCAKAFATRMVTISRETVGLFACHEVHLPVGDSRNEQVVHCPLGTFQVGQQPVNPFSHGFPPLVEERGGSSCAFFTPGAGEGQHG